VSDGPVLETVVVGPKAGGLRGAGAVRFYATTPAAHPRPARIDRALAGAGTALHAIKLVVTDRALPVGLPTGLTFLAGFGRRAGHLRRRPR
jgi:hypothetical protein